MRRRRSERGFSLIEVIVSLAILGLAVPALQASLGAAVDKAILTKVNRQLRAVAQFQYGQVLVGKLHPEETDPFLDGQTGGFEDVGGYREEYAEYGWELRVEEVAVAGASNTDLEEAGFADDGSGMYARPYTDDLAEKASGGAGGGGFASLFGGDQPRPEGQFRKRITLTVRWAAESAEQDRVYTLVTLVPADEGEPSGADLPGALGGPGTEGAAGGAGAGARGNPFESSTTEGGK